mgnify:CR=1 FL=1
MMFKEIRTKEKITDKTEEKSNNYLNIKPDTKMSMEELENFWIEEFKKAAEEHK